MAFGREAAIAATVIDSSELDGEFVLENTRGEVVRSFRWATSKVVIVRRADTRRIETVADIGELKAKGIPFSVIAETSPEKVRRAPVRIGQAGVLRWNTKALRVVGEHELAEDRVLDKKRMIAWSAGLQLALAAVFVISGLLSNQDQKKANEPTVTLLPEKTVEKMLNRVSESTASPSRAMTKVAAATPKTRVVAPSENKIVKARQMKASVRQTARNNQRVSARGGGGYKSAGARRGSGTNEPRMNEIGALAAFDQPRVKGGNGGRGGLNLQAVGTEPGSGAGGRGYGGFGNNGAGGRGKGQGLANSMYGKGLIASPFGDGTPSAGSGGYGTRGRAGGGAHGAGYGTATVVGSWKGTGPHGDGPAGSGWGKGGEGIGSGEIEADASVAEGLDRSQVDAVIRRNIGQIVYCYEQGLQRSPSLKGRVGVKFMIGPNGRVSSAGVARSSLRHAKVESCMIGKLKTWAFPKPLGGVTVAVSYPFMLDRQSR